MERFTELILTLSQATAPLWALLGVAAAPYLQGRREDQADRRTSLREKREFKRDTIFSLQQSALQLRLSLDKLKELDRNLAAAAQPAYDEEAQLRKQDQYRRYEEQFTEHLEKCRQHLYEVELFGSRVSNDELRDSADQQMKMALAVMEVVEDYMRVNEYAALKIELDERYKVFRKCVSRALEEI